MGSKDSAVVAKTSFRISRLNFMLWSATALGVGCLWSFGIFYSAWKTQCKDLLMEQEIASHTSAQEFKKKFQLSQMELEQCESHVGGRADASRELARVLHHVQQRNRAACLRTYGYGPYAVMFTLNVPGYHGTGPAHQQNTIMIGIEFASVDVMPSTVYQFLELVRHDFYQGTTIGLSSSSTSATSHAALAASPNLDPTSLLTGGNPNDAVSKLAKAQLLKKYNDWFGDAASNDDPKPFFVKKTDLRKGQLPCHQYSFGIIDDGPDFALFLEKAPKSGQQPHISCPGKIVEGSEHLPALRNMLLDQKGQHGSTNQRVTIVQAKVVGFPEGSEDVDGFPGMKSEL